MIEQYVARIDFEALRLVAYGGQEYEGDFHFTAFTTESLGELMDVPDSPTSRSSQPEDPMATVWSSRSWVSSRHEALRSPSSSARTTVQTVSAKRSNAFDANATTTSKSSSSTARRPTTPNRCSASTATPSSWHATRSPTCRFRATSESGHQRERSLPSSTMTRCRKATG